MGSALLLILLMAFNFAISWWNARVAGQIWQETKAIGGWIRVVAWSAAVQSACGFTCCFAIVLIGGSGLLHLINSHTMTAGLNLMYITIIFPLLGSGLAITIQSWITAYRERDFLSMGVATYNTFAMGWDTVDAFQNLGPAFSSVTKFFASDDDDEDFDAKAFIVIAVLGALAAGVFLTRHIMVKAMGTLPLPAGPTGSRPPPAPRQQQATA
jgi:hypothetical protein